jgi:hypothetical protein
LNTELFRFFKHPSSAISQAAYQIYKFAQVKGDLVEFPLEQYNALCELFERKEFTGNEDQEAADGIS